MNAFPSLLTVIALTAAGMGPVRFFDRRATGAFLLGESFLAGSGIGALVLLVADLLHLRWSVLVLAAGLILLSFPFWWRIASEIVPPKPPSLSATQALIAACTGLLVTAYASFAVRPELWSWRHWLISRRDFFFIWGFKGKLFFSERGIPWDFLRTMPNDFSHPDYPLLVPLLYDVPAIFSGSWRGQAIGILDAALGAALISVVWQSLREEFDPTFAALGTLALTGSALLPFAGFAEIPLVAFGGSAALLLRRRLRDEQVPTSLAVAFLALAAMTKNEGIALIVSMAVGLATSSAGRKLIARLWPAVAVTLIWLAIRYKLGLATDVLSGPLHSRFLQNVPSFIQAFAEVPTYQPFLWCISLLAIALAPRENVDRERFLLTTAVTQLAFYLAVYSVTPLDLAGHVNGSWDRITSHVTILLAFAGIASIGRAMAVDTGRNLTGPRNTPPEVSSQ